MSTENNPLPDGDGWLIRNEGLVRAGIIIGAIVLAATLWELRPRSTFAADGMTAGWDAAVEQSKAAHTPSIVIFTADWCPACARLHESVLSLPGIQSEMADHYTTFTVDLTSQGPAAVARAQKYGVSGIPTVIRFDAQGKETDRVHYLPPDRMLAWLREGE